MAAVVRIEVTRTAQQFAERSHERIKRKADKKTMLRVGAILAGAVARQVQAFTSQSKGRKTGALMRSWETTHSSANGEDSITYFSKLRYAAKLQTGGRIRPVAAKNLAIPLTESIGALGPRDLNVEFSWPIYLKTGSKILVDVDTGKPLFVLKPFVDLNGPYVGYIDRAAEKGGDKANELLWDILIDDLEKAAKDTTDKGKT